MLRIPRSGFSFRHRVKRIAGWRRRLRRKSYSSAPPLSSPRLCVNHSPLSPNPTPQVENFLCPASTVIRFTPANAVPFCRTLARKRHSLVALAGVSSTAM